MARVEARMLARVTGLGSARGHHARPHGTRHGTGGGIRPVSRLGSWATYNSCFHHDSFVAFENLSFIITL